MKNEGSSEGSSSPDSGCVSLKSDQSITPPPNFSDEPEIFRNNPRAEDGLQGWEAKNGGDSWVTENNRKPNRRISLKRPLKKKGYSDAFLDLQPPIKISDWCAPRAEFEIELKKKKFLEFEKVMLKEENDKLFHQMTHIFEEDKPGVQFIRGKDTQFWKGCVDHGGEFRSTAELHKYACDLTLDPNTAYTRLILSEENRKITYVKDHQPYPDHPERFDDVPQVLCEESLTGRCYWEFEWSRRAEISVTYKGISRKGGKDCVFGFNDKSWSLNCYNNRFSVCHNKNLTDIPVLRSSSKRVGVYVDVSAGTLSFYSVSDTHTLTHLHTFNTTFTEPLYAGFGVYYNSSVSLCDIKQQTHTLADTDFFLL